MPYHLRRNAFKQATRWLSERVGAPAGSVLSTYYGLVSHKLVVRYRRVSTRLAALVLNALEDLQGVAPGRT